MVIPNTVKYIGSYAFAYCSLTEMYFEENPEIIEYMHLDKKVIIYGIPGGTVEEYAKTYGHKFVNINEK